MAETLQTIGIIATAIGTIIGGVVNIHLRRRIERLEQDR